MTRHGLLYAAAISSITFSLAGCGPESIGAEGTTDFASDEPGRELVVGSFAARFDDTLRGGGVVAEGASLSGRLDAIAKTSANVTIAGIPAGATVQRALLYWIISGGTDTTATLNAAAVTGVSLGTAGSACWGTTNTAFRADVTGLVTGNGVYAVGGLPSSTVGNAADTDGVALVVSYQDATSGTRRRVIVRDGTISADASGDLISDAFTGLGVPFTAGGRFHLVVGDGQTFADGALAFAGATIATDQWSGSDGPLWDVRSYNVTLTAAQSTATWSNGLLSDCLVHSTAVLDFPVAVCGDGLRTGGEACEQGNAANGDGCSSTCDVEPGWSCTAGPPSICTPICGDGIRVGSEQCDQGNLVSGDGCSPTCTIEPGWSCSGTPSVCGTICGDGLISGAEQCDDGGTAPGDGCDGACALEAGWSCSGTPSVCGTTCGDGVIAGAEQCDDGGTAAGDGCSAACSIEAGWSCAGTPSVCGTTCGDGIPAGTEACDDGATAADDGCSAACAIEAGWSCTGSPSACSTTCGDGVRAGTEVCDDGNLTGGDGCSATCAVESGWTCDAAQPSRCTEDPSSGCGCGSGGANPWSLTLIVVALATGLGRRRRFPARA